MHEMSVCENLLQILEENARTQRFTRVKTVWLEVGALSCVEVEALRFCFDAVMRDTLAAGARLAITVVPGRAWCERCQAGHEVVQRLACCPACGELLPPATGGDELRVIKLEVE